MRAQVNKPPGPNDTLTVEQWMNQLISTIGMKVMYGPVAMYCSVDGNKGLTAFAIIETSHCSVHTWDECTPAVINCDVYTCSDLDPADVFEALEVFEPIRMDWKFLDRENGLELVSEGVRT